MYNKDFKKDIIWWISTFLCQVLGNKGGVTLINATAAQYQASATNLNISNVFLTFLSEDDKIILNTGPTLSLSLSFFLINLICNNSILA